jgi:SAM-dependent methyltransferase
MRDIFLATAEDGIDGKLYYVRNNMKHWILSPQVHSEIGADLEVRSIKSEILDSIPEGTPISEASSRNDITDDLANDRSRAVRLRIPIHTGSGLEISPGNNPIVRSEFGAHVSYCEKATSEDWELNYGAQLNRSDIITLGDKELSDVFEPNSFDYIVSSHVIEHVPDIISHFMQCSLLLKPAGKLAMIIPDKRYTFDVLRDETTFSELVQSYDRSLKYPSVHMIEDFYLHLDRNANTENLWSGSYLPAPSYTKAEVTEILESVRDNPEKIDIHCWTFTPDSFKQLASEFVGIYSDNLTVKDISQTPEGRNEFLVILENSA